MTLVPDNFRLSAHVGAMLGAKGFCDLVLMPVGWAFERALGYPRACSKVSFICYLSCKQYTDYMRNIQLRVAVVQGNRIASVIRIPGIPNENPSFSAASP